MKKIISNKEIITFLNSVSIMSASTFAPEGPHNSILLFVVDDDFTFYFSTLKNSRKVRALIANPHLAFSVWEFEKMLVQASGTAEPVVKEEEIDRIYDKLASAVGRMKNFWPPALHIAGDEHVIYKVSVNQMSVLSLNDLTIHNYKDSFIKVALPA